MRNRYKNRDEIISTIGEVMTSRVVSVSPQDSILKAAEKLAAKNIGVVLVIKDQKLVGILSERDFVTKVTLKKLNPAETPVARVMTRKLFWAKPEDSLTRVFGQMKRKHIRHIPVVDSTRHVFGIISIRDLLTRMEENLRSLIKKSTRDLSIDSLTGLYNYRFFNDYLDAEIARSERRNYHFCVLFMDLDYFKIFNDTHGHAKGNLLLKQFSKILKPSEERKKREFSVRRSDIAIRLGGDEFVLILPETIKEGARICADRLRQVVANSVYRFKNDRNEYHTTVSVGIAEFPADATRKDDLIERADQALYMAKRFGRNRVHLYNH